MSVARTMRVHFAIDVENVYTNYTVYVTGSSASLGLWKPQNAVPLVPDAERPNRYRGFIDTTDESVKFRYFIGYMLMSETGERLIIDKWEAFSLPEIRPLQCRKSRRPMSSESCRSFRLLCRPEMHIGGLASIRRRKSNPPSPSRKRLEFTPLDVRNKQASGARISFNSGEDEEEEDEDSNAAPCALPTHSTTDVAILSDPKPKYHRQDETGAFYIEVFSEEKKRIGACYALPSSLADTAGISQLPFINSTGRPIGQISLEYLFVRALNKPIPYQSMETSYCRHWKKRNALEVGHRGAGNSYTKFAMARENTIHSLNTAAKNGADYVEFDVQLTKDKVAIIYHDFHVLVSVARRGLSSSDLTKLASGNESYDGSLDFHELPVKDLKLSQMKLLMLDHLAFPQKKDNVKKLVERGEEEEDFKPFPTLMEALVKVDPDVGFNVEVKYPMMQNNGEHECDHYFERNEFVDIILADVLNNAGNRRIMFSSFDPDICSLVATKQNKYPVFFLCVGDTQRYTPFQDQRTSTSMTAVNFAAGADLLGVNFNSEDLLKDPLPVKRANELGLVTFVWGEDLDKKENINYFKKELGVDGVIYDRIGEEERRRNVFIVEREQKRALLSSSGASTPQRAPSPVEAHTHNHGNLSPSINGNYKKSSSDPVLKEEDEDEITKITVDADKIALQPFNGIAPRFQLTQI
ncbi:unnamed protein product [Caenorhabditis auriculariae]|uniref:GP-PDE domain-containing protein n=1 Tax=Caenorhabditis auriculariae TaxID=2777116 RepID=A0A8S1HH98_9PELO|nr:unnamed protein product [Caenorhabditis auriculariae]